MIDKTRFEDLLLEHKNAVERFVYYKTPSKTDGDDVLQEVYLTAFQNFGNLKSEESFKAWLLSIASNKCNDFYRNCARKLEISLDDVTVSVLSQSSHGTTVREVVSDTLDILGDKDKEILFLYYFRNKPQAEIAKLLNIPVGTVKSRLYTAKQNFRECYPYMRETQTAESEFKQKQNQKQKGENIDMSNKKQLPDIMPNFTITKSDREPFEVRWEETMGWFIIPKLGFECNWAMYDYPDKNRTETVEMKVTGKANVHGIEGVEIVSYEHNPKEFNATDDNKTVERRFVAQLTDTHVRMLAESHYRDDVKYYYTFLDGEEFIPNWGFGEDNCGKEVLVKPKGMIKCDDKDKDEKSFTVPNVPFTFFDIAGRYIVEINGRSYDTIRVMDIEYYNDGVMAEHYIDENGRTVLWRRYNRDNWAISRYKQKWSEKFPDNERIIINGELYIHWYDCITDYIL